MTTDATEVNRRAGGAGPVQRYLEEDHRRLEALLNEAFEGTEIDGPAFEAFRGGLLRHIGMEEKILLPAARRVRNGEPLPVARQLRLDHGALAALLVPTPTHEIIEQIRSLLVLHNPLEEGPGGLYQVCEELLAGEADALLEQLRDAPEVPLAPHHDGAGAFQGIERLMSAAAKGRA